MRKNLGPTKDSREKIWDPRHTHGKKFRTHEGTMTRWHETHDSARPTEFSALIFYQSIFKFIYVMEGYISKRWATHQQLQQICVIFFCSLKGYLCYKTITFENVSSEAQVKNFHIS